jgi:hypothetical protein
MTCKCGSCDYLITESLPHDPAQPESRQKNMPMENSRKNVGIASTSPISSPTAHRRRIWHSHPNTNMAQLQRHRQEIIVCSLNKNKKNTGNPNTISKSQHWMVDICTIYRTVVYYSIVDMNMGLCFSPT